MKPWNSTRLARLAAASVAVGVALGLAAPATAAAAAAPSDPPSGAVDPGPNRPDVPDARMKNPAPSPGPSSPSGDSGFGPAPSADPAPAPSAPAPQRKDKPPDRDAHKFSPAKRTPAGQSTAQRDNDNKRDTTFVPAPAGTPAPAPAPGAGQGLTPQAGAAAMLNGMSNVLVSANRTVNDVLATANKTVQQVISQLPTPQLTPGLTIVRPAETPAPRDHGVQALDDDDVGPAPAHVREWIDAAIEELRKAGIELEEGDAERIWQIIAHESSGDPNAINDWDSNAAAGIPSQGLMQVIPPTFDAYKLPGHGDILNPVDNIIAGVRYTLDRYGSLAEHPGIESIANGGSYQPYSAPTGR
jgi:Transglycosylase SLT domain